MYLIMAYFSKDVYIRDLIKVEEQPEALRGGDDKVWCQDPGLDLHTNRLQRL